jgi:O-antigen ligase
VSISLRLLLPKLGHVRGSFLELWAFRFFVGIIAWAPFPLGSNRPWSWSLLVLLIVFCWLLWCCSIWRKPEIAIPLVDDLRGPLILALLAITWAVIQVTPVASLTWISPVWHTTETLLGGKVAATISVSPWRSTTELMKLASYAMAAWLARVFARAPSRAYELLDAVIVIGAAYAAYGFVLFMIGQSQFEFFYGLPLQQIAHEFPGPFVGRNNFATYEGLIALCAGSRLITKTWSHVDTHHGPKARLLSAAHYLVGKGAVLLVAALLSVSAVIMTGSRGGNLATWSAAFALLLMGLGLARRQRRGSSALAVAFCVIAAAFALLAINGTTLAARVDDMVGTTDVTRLLLWNAALKMIHEAPLTGWGLGTYQLVYPLYATNSMHFFMDKAHNDILEFAAGFGLPAAFLWWGLLAWLVVICGRGVIVRRRHRMLPALGLAATILVSIHSIFDFSLQMPAVALTYAVILGMGVAQAFPTTKQMEGGEA